MQASVVKMVQSATGCRQSIHMLVCGGTARRPRANKGWGYDSCCSAKIGQADRYIDLDLPSAVCIPPEGPAV